MSSKRQRQLQVHLKRELSRIIRRELEIPGMELVSITHTEVTPDLREATVYISHIKDDETLRAKALKTLKRREKEIRAALTRALSTKTIPALRFREDTSIKEAARITDIIRDLQEEREERDRDERS